MFLNGKVINVIAASEATDKVERVAVRIDDADSMFDVIRVKNTHSWPLNQKVWMEISGFKHAAVPAGEPLTLSPAAVVAAAENDL
jgi:starvation-inducible outer membrane lipoprotein